MASSRGKIQIYNSIAKILLRMEMKHGNLTEIKTNVNEINVLKRSTRCLKLGG